MQWPAVKICLFVSTEPPQKCPPRLVIDTSQGNSPWAAFSPPTIFPVRLIDVFPHSTSATFTEKKTKRSHRICSDIWYVNK